MLTLFLVGMSVGANNLAVALALGSLDQLQRRLRIIPVFGVVEFTVPLVGLWLGARMARGLTDLMVWLPTALIAGMGVATLVVSTRQHLDEKKLARRTTSWGGLLLLSIGLSLDNLVIGFGLGARELPPLSVAGTISLFSMTFAWIGLRVGALVRERGRSAAAAGSGILLILLAAYLQLWG